MYSSKEADIAVLEIRKNRKHQKENNSYSCYSGIAIGVLIGICIGCFFNPYSSINILQYSSKKDNE